jgi:hypothetical protein
MAQDPAIKRVYIELDSVKDLVGAGPAARSDPAAVANGEAEDH